MSMTHLVLLALLLPVQPWPRLLLTGSQQGRGPRRAAGLSRCRCTVLACCWRLAGRWFGSCAHAGGKASGVTPAAASRKPQRVALDAYLSERGGSEPATSTRRWLASAACRASWPARCAGTAIATTPRQRAACTHSTAQQHVLRPPGSSGGAPAPCEPCPGCAVWQQSCWW